MGKNLTNKNRGVSSGTKLTDRTQFPFKVAIDYSLENNYCFKDLKTDGIKSFHRFIESTVGQQLTISEVDNLYLRTKGGRSEKRNVHGQERAIMHYGKDRKKFRVFGYYNQKGYFVLSRIDPKHNTHKS